MKPTRRASARPIESVELKVTFRADRETATKIKRWFPTAVVRGGVCVVKIDGVLPSDVEAKAKVLLDRIREIEGPARGRSR